MEDRKYTEYASKADEAGICAQAICDRLVNAARENPDAVRALLGSVDFRRVEEYASLREQKEAAFTEWFYAMSAEEKPFG